jgi:hypothetical protein
MNSSSSVVDSRVGKSGTKVAVEHLCVCRVLSNRRGPRNRKRFGLTTDRPRYIHSRESDGVHCTAHRKAERVLHD